MPNRTRSGNARPSCFRYLVLLCCVTACSQYGVVITSTPPLDGQAPPPDGLAQICILRPHSIGAGDTAVVRDNGLLVGATRGPSYFCYLAHPGLHHITSHTNPVRALDAQVAAGETLYLHQHVRVGADRLARIDPATANQMLERCDYSLLIAARNEDIAIEAPCAQPERPGENTASRPEKVQSNGSLLPTL